MGRKHVPARVPGRGQVDRRTLQPGVLKGVSASDRRRLEQHFAQLRTLLTAAAERRRARS